MHTQQWFFRQLRSWASTPAVLALVVATPNALLAQRTLTSDQTAEIDAVAIAPIELGQAAGMSIAVVRGTDTLLMSSYGHADVELSVATPGRAVYEIGSVTKQFTAAAVLLLQEDGALSLDDPLTKWLPNYPLAGRTLTVRRLLDHTSGIKGYTEMPAVWGEIVPLELPRDTLMTLFAAEPFDFEPGEALIYNNSAYFLLGLIIEKASGETYEDFVEKRLFAATGMNDSRYCHKEELTPGRTKGYQYGPEGLEPAAYLNHLWPYAAGSLCSTVRDLVAWQQGLHGDGGGGNVLSPESYAAMISPEPLNDGTPTRYAKGLAITERGGEKRISHGGGIFGFLSELRYLPDEDLTIAVLINTTGPVAPADVADEIERVILGAEPTPIARQFGGSVDDYMGNFRGPGRGRRLNVSVGVDGEGRLQLHMPPQETRQIVWLGENTFAYGNARYEFRSPGENGFEELRVDEVAGHYVLRRITR